MPNNKTVNVAGSAAAAAATACHPGLQHAIDRYEHSHEDLRDHERSLHDRVELMESFVPVAIVQNLLQADEAHRDCGPQAALERVRQMMRELGPESPDPVDELLGQLCAKIQEIDGRSAQLHDKIKCVDERLLKGREELCALEKSNRELEQRIQQTELELERQASIGSITSADRACIARMRRLAEEAVCTKRNIRALEARQALMLGRVEAVFRSGNARCYRLCENNVAAAASRQKHHVYRPKLKKKRCIQKNRSREFWPNASCHSCCHGVKDHHHHHHRVVEYVESKSAQHVNSKEGCEGYGGHDLRKSSRHTCGEGKQKERTTCRVKEEEDVEEEEEEEENCQQDNPWCTSGDLDAFKKIESQTNCKDAKARCNKE